MAKAKAPVEEPVTTPDLPESPAEETVPETPVAETTATETPAVPATPSFLDRVKELGFQDVADENAARDRLLADYQTRIAREKELADELNQQKVYAKYGQEYLEGLRSNHQPSAQTPPPERKDWWSPPKYEQAVAERYREAKEGGAYGWKDNTPAEIRASAEAYQAYVENWAHQLATNPVQALQPLVEDIEARITKKFEEQYKGYRQQETTEEFVDRTRRENDWMYEKDPRTNQTNFSRLSAEGQKISQFISEAEQEYQLPPQKAWAYAKRLYDAEQAHTTTAQITQQQTNQDVAAAQKKTLIQKARGLGSNRNGSAPPATNPNASVQNPMLSAGAMLREQMRTDGVSLS